MDNLNQTKRARPRKPSAKQAKAIKHWLENGGSKGEALQAAGYSEAMALNPQKVFNSPAVQTLLDAAGINPVSVLQQLERKAYARKLEHMTFPPYSPEKAREHEVKADETLEDLSEQIRGEQLTDTDIREMFDELGMSVRRIVHGDMVRHVYYWAENHMANLDAIDKIINLFGLYAPKRLETKNAHTVGVWSMADLRKKMQENDVRIIEHEHGDTGVA